MQEPLASMVCTCSKQGLLTTDTVPLLHSRQHLELLEHVDSVVQDVQHDRDEDGKADPPGGASRGSTVRPMPVTATARRTTSATRNSSHLESQAVNASMAQAWQVASKMVMTDNDWKQAKQAPYS